MDEVRFKSFDDLPLTLTVMEVAEALRISRAGAYDLVRTEGPLPRLPKLPKFLLLLPSKSLKLKSSRMALTFPTNPL